MRASLILAIALLLTAGLAWAEEPTPAGAASPSRQAAPEGSALDGGGCLLPDLAGLSAYDATAALEGAGFGISAVQQTAPACPRRFSCSSITNCAIGGLCAETDIGPCCSPSSGVTLCCLQGSIKVRRCPCTCTIFPCNVLCTQSSDVQWQCS